MSHPYLSSAWAKFDRAENQSADIRAELIRAFDPDQNPVQRHQNHETGEVSWVWAEGNPNFWVELSLDMGEFFHNLRSCLDHIAWAFARVGAVQQGRIDPYRRTSFPLLTDPSNWDGTVRQSLRDVPIRGQAFIKRFQPFQTRNNGFNQNLLLISKLNNTDKHSLLNPTGTSIVSARRTNFVPGTDNVIDFEDIPGRAAKLGSELYSTVIPLDADVQVDFAFLDLIEEPREGIELTTRRAIPKFVRVVRFVLSSAERVINAL